MTRGGAVWSARVAHNHKVVGSNPTPATSEFIKICGKLPQIFKILRKNVTKYNKCIDKA